MSIGTLSWHPCTIANGAALSDAIATLGKRLVAVFQPADCEGTAFGIQASHDGGTTYTIVYNTIQEATGAAPVTAAWEIAKSATLAQYFNLSVPFTVLGATHIKLQSQDGSAAATNQTTAA